MLLGKRSLPMGDRRRQRIRYEDFLCQGQKIITVTVNAPSGTSSTIDTVSITNDETAVVFFVNCAEVNETFTATVQVTLNDTEVVTDTVDYTIA